MHFDSKFDCIIWKYKSQGDIGLMHLALLLGESPYYSPSPALVSFLKVGIPPLKINIFQRHKYR